MIQLLGVVVKKVKIRKHIEKSNCFPIEQQGLERRDNKKFYSLNRIFFSCSYVSQFHYVISVICLHRGGDEYHTNHKAQSYAGRVIILFKPLKKYRYKTFFPTHEQSAVNHPL